VVTALRSHGRGRRFNPASAHSFPGARVDVCAGELAGLDSDEALYDTTLIVHGGPGAEMNSDVAGPSIAAALFQALGVIFLIIALVKHYLARTNPGPYIEPLLQATDPQRDAAGTGSTP
jgi:hypothetical protein